MNMSEQWATQHPNHRSSIKSPSGSPLSPGSHMPFGTGTGVSPSSAVSLTPLATYPAGRQTHNGAVASHQQPASPFDYAPFQHHDGMAL